MSIPASATLVYSATIGAIGAPMSADLTPQAKRRKETWKDWLPDGLAMPTDPVTREQLIAGLRNTGVRVSNDDFRNWQRYGVLPYGIRRRHRESGSTRVLYPRWFDVIIRELRRLQGEGYTLEQIGPKLRAFLFTWATASFPGGPTAGDDPRAGIENPPAVSDLTPALQAIARAHEATVGRRVTRIETTLERDATGDATRLSVHVFDEAGVWFTYGYP